MKVKALVKFKDKHTGEIHKKNSVFDVTEKRYNEILEVGKYVEKVVDAGAAETTEAPKKRTTKKAE